MAAALAELAPAGVASSVTCMISPMASRVRAANSCSGRQRHASLASGEHDGQMGSVQNHLAPLDIYSKNESNERCSDGAVHSDICCASKGLLDDSSTRWHDVQARSGIMMTQMWDGPLGVYFECDPQGTERQPVIADSNAEPEMERTELHMRTASTASLSVRAHGQDMALQHGAHDCSNEWAASSAEYIGGTDGVDQGDSMLKSSCSGALNVPSQTSTPLSQYASSLAPTRAQHSDWRTPLTATWAASFEEFMGGTDGVDQVDRGLESPCSGASHALPQVSTQFSQRAPSLVSPARAQHPNWHAPLTAPRVASLEECIGGRDGVDQVDRGLESPCSGASHALPQVSMPFAQRVPSLAPARAQHSDWRAMMTASRAAAFDECIGETDGVDQGGSVLESSCSGALHVPSQVSTSCSLRALSLAPARAQHSDWRVPLTAPLVASFEEYIGGINCCHELVTRIAGCQCPPQRLHLAGTSSVGVFLLRDSGRQAPHRCQMRRSSSAPQTSASHLHQHRQPLGRLELPPRILDCQCPPQRLHLAGTGPVRVLPPPDGGLQAPHRCHHCHCRRYASVSHQHRQQQLPGRQPHCSIVEAPPRQWQVHPLHARPSVSTPFSLRAPSLAPARAQHSDWRDPLTASRAAACEECIGEADDVDQGGSVLESSCSGALHVSSQVSTPFSQRAPLLAPARARHANWRATLTTTWAASSEEYIGGTDGVNQGDSMLESSCSGALHEPSQVSTCQRRASDVPTTCQRRASAMPAPCQRRAQHSDWQAHVWMTTYVWMISHARWNALMHALHGNTTPVSGAARTLSSACSHDLLSDSSGSSGRADLCEVCCLPVELCPETFARGGAVCRRCDVSLDTLRTTPYPLLTPDGSPAFVSSMHSCSLTWHETMLAHERLQDCLGTSAGMEADGGLRARVIEAFRADCRIWADTTQLCPHCWAGHVGVLSERQSRPSSPPLLSTSSHSASAEEHIGGTDAQQLFHEALRTSGNLCQGRCSRPTTATTRHGDRRNQLKTLYLMTHAACRRVCKHPLCVRV